MHASQEPKGGNLELEFTKFWGGKKKEGRRKEREKKRPGAKREIKSHTFWGQSSQGKTDTVIQTWVDLNEKTPNGKIGGGGKKKKMKKMHESTTTTKGRREGGGARCFQS